MDTDRAGLVDQARSIIQTLKGDPEALGQAVLALGEETGKTILLVEGARNGGPPREEEVRRIGGLLSCVLNVGVVMVPGFTPKLMMDLSVVVDGFLQEWNANHRALLATQQGERVNIVHLRTMAEKDGEWYPEARGGITLAMVTDGAVVSFGAAFCHPVDQYSKRAGANVAVARALASRQAETFCGRSYSVEFLQEGDFHEVQKTLLCWTLDTHDPRTDNEHRTPFKTWRSPWSCEWFLRTGSDAEGHEERGKWRAWGGSEVFVEWLVREAMALANWTEPDAGEE